MGAYRRNPTYTLFYERPGIRPGSPHWLYDSPQKRVAAARGGGMGWGRWSGREEGGGVSRERQRREIRGFQVKSRGENVLRACEKEARWLAGWLSRSLAPSRTRADTHAARVAHARGFWPCGVASPRAQAQRSRPPASPFPSAKTPSRCPRMTRGARGAPRAGARGESYLRKGKGSQEQEAAADKYSLGSLGVSF